jgi:predicted NodU family carbamoyl transferase
MITLGIYCIEGLFHDAAAIVINDNEIIWLWMLAQHLTVLC